MTISCFSSYRGMCPLPREAWKIGLNSSLKSAKRMPICCLAIIIERATWTTFTKPSPKKWSCRPWPECFLRSCKYVPGPFPPPLKSPGYEATHRYYFATSNTWKIHPRPLLSHYHCTFTPIETAYTFKQVVILPDAFDPKQWCRNRSMVGRT